MLLMGSTNPTDDMMAASPNDAFLSVYNSTSAAKAEQEMLGRMIELNLGVVSFSHGFMQASTMAITTTYQAASQQTLLALRSRRQSFQQ